MNGATLRLERTWAEPADALWRALTDPELCGRWFARWPGSPGPGDVVALTLTAVPGEPVEDATVTACEPGRRLVLDWDEPGETLWQVTVELAAAGDGTHVVLEHRTRDTPVGGYEPGWTAALDRWCAVAAQTAPGGAQPAT